MDKTPKGSSGDWLPENVHNFAAETIRTWRKDPILKQEVIFIDRAFHSEGMKKIWGRMDKIPEAPMKLAQLLVDSFYTLKVLPENYEAIRDRKDRLQAAIVRLENERKKLVELDKTGYIALPLEEALHRIQQNLGGYLPMSKNMGCLIWLPLRG